MKLCQQPLTAGYNIIGQGPIGHLSINLLLYTEIDVSLYRPTTYVKKTGPLALTPCGART